MLRFNKKCRAGSRALEMEMTCRSLLPSVLSHKASEQRLSVWKSWWFPCFDLRGTVVELGLRMSGIGKENEVELGVRMRRVRTEDEES